MAVYKLFPEKSATLYSYYPTLNTGLDEILELSTFESMTGTYEVSRPIIKFSRDEIFDIISNKVSGASYSAALRLSLANASQVPLNYTIFCHPLATSWEVGNGRFGNSPITTTGASWQYKNQLSGSPWFTFFPAGRTGSYNGTNIGGGLWYAYETTTQSFVHNDSLDINLDVSSIVSRWYSGDIDMVEGFILKHSSSLEFTSASKFETKYFSANTHTIYPPCLEIKWNDYLNTNFAYDNNGTGSPVIQPVYTSNVTVTLANNQGKYRQNAVQRFRVNIREKYPARQFSAASVYLANKVFPSSSCYQIRDLDTDEVVIDFDYTYTRLSQDTTSMYFDVYMNGLEPERYYKILIKASGLDVTQVWPITTLYSGTYIFDDNYYFKVIK